MAFLTEKFNVEVLWWGLKREKRYTAEKPVANNAVENVE
jgi:hypothetical protein